MSSNFDVWRKDAEGVLTRAGLPTEPWVESEQGVSALDWHAEQVGHKFGSVEHLAALLVNRLGRYADAPDAASSERWVREVQRAQGHLVQAWEARKAGTQGGSSSKRKAWAEWAAQQVSRFDDLPDTTDDPLEYGMHDVYRDGDRVVCFGDGKDDSLARSTFEKRYLK